MSCVGKNIILKNLLVMSIQCIVFQKFLRALVQNCFENFLCNLSIVFSISRAYRKFYSWFLRNKNKPSSYVSYSDLTSNYFHQKR